MPSAFVRRELIAVAVGLASLAACKKSTEPALPDEALTIRSSDKVAEDVSSMRDELAALSGVLEFVESRDEKSFLRRMSPAGAPVGAFAPREDLFPVAGRHSLAIAAPNRDDASEQLVFLDGDVIRSIGEEAGQIRSPVVAGDGSFAIYESNIESFRDLYRAEVDTGAQRRLTEDGDGAFDPSLSPDSAHAVFVTTAAGQADLHIIATDGTSRHPLTETPTNETSPRWSPDGRSIAFSSDADGPERLFVMAAGGGAPKRLTASTASDEHEVDPLWSPKGDMLAFLQHNRAGQSELWVGSWPAGKTWRVSKDAGHAKFAEWSPDGRFLWYSDGSDQTDIWAARSDGSERLRLTQGSSEAWLPRYRAGAALE